MSRRFTHASLEAIYSKYHHRRFVHPDPLEVLYRYDAPADREVVALVASCLAYGRVGQILVSVNAVLDKMGRPSRFVRTTSPARVRRTFRDFKHRFTTGDELARLLVNAGRILERDGSLGGCFAQGLRPDDETTHAALVPFAAQLTGGRRTSLVPDPRKQSACKRLHLMLRWLCRRDAIDPGGWPMVSPRQLVVPLDTHMFQIARAHGLTRRRSAERQAALEITRAFAEISPDDPVRYDFALTRPGIGGY